MTTKAKKAPAKASAKTEAKAAPAKKMSKAEMKAAAAEAEKALAAAAQNGEGDEESEEDDGATTASGGGAGGNAAALAAATSSTEMSASFKNFRHHPDMENFYRFIYENDLRLEALAIIDEMANQKLLRKQVAKAKSQAH